MPREIFIFFKYMIIIIILMNWGITIIIGKVIQHINLESL